ncbi:hypothetical protein [Pseudomonas sp. SCB32]|uniref:hypothetical protein n=1 Tax=Pseudomonas sp. SCB32 TaxID=2653853 RepID=UPI0012657004|nr:hypothetical protein [Pseudomonas sp. SCB32]
MNEPQRPFASAGHRENDGVASNTLSAFLRTRIAEWRKKRLLRLALRVAEEPILMLEVSQSPGTFWPVLLEHSNRIIVATSPATDSLLAAHQKLPSAMTQRIKTMPEPMDYSELGAGSVDCILISEVPPTDCNAATIRLLDQLHPVTRDTVILFARVGRQRSLNEAGQACPCGASPSSHSVTPNPTSAKALEQAFQRVGFSQIKHYNFLPGMDGIRVYVLRK